MWSRKKRSPFILLMKTLRKDEEFFCTPQAFANIKDRVEQFQKQNPLKRFWDWQYRGVCHVKRME
jgi:hypothetical protein